jgi:hypothetical protein
MFGKKSVYSLFFLENSRCPSAFLAEQHVFLNANMAAVNEKFFFCDKGCEVVPTNIL